MHSGRRGGELFLLKLVLLILLLNVYIPPRIISTYQWSRPERIETPHETHGTDPLVPIVGIIRDHGIDIRWFEIGGFQDPGGIVGRLRHGICVGTEGGTSQWSLTHGGKVTRSIVVVVD